MVLGISRGFKGSKTFFCSLVFQKETSVHASDRILFIYSRTSLRRMLLACNAPIGVLVDASGFIELRQELTGQMPRDSNIH